MILKTTNYTDSHAHCVDTADNNNLSNVPAAWTPKISLENPLQEFHLS